MSEHASEATAQDWTQGVDAILIRKCPRCDRRWYLPRDVCPGCGSAEVSTMHTDGAGVCAAVTVLAATKDRSQRAFCLIDLDDGPRMMSRCEADLRAGDRAIATYDDSAPYFVKG